MSRINFKPISYEDIRLTPITNLLQIRRMINDVLEEKVNEDKNFNKGRLKK